ncbi:DUF2335 domain-containing protein [Azospirillum sp. Sh1]|nr:DUF2335 domain-containing protein [Azospirillum sp. Sh1]
MGKHSDAIAPMMPDQKIQKTDPTKTPSAQQGAFPVPEPLENTIEQALEGMLGPEKAEEASAAVVRILERHERFEGPMPPPALLRQYEEIVPGAAERILAMAERQLDHQIDWERTAISAQARNAFWGLSYGFIIGIALIGGAIFCAVAGHEQVALALVGASALGLVPAFVNAWKQVHRGESTSQPSQDPDGKRRK